MEDNIFLSDVSDEVIVKHALKLLQHVTWPHFQMILLAQELGISSSKLYNNVRDKADLLKKIINEIDNWTHASYQEIQQPESTNIHDQLFDLIMCRLEVIQPYKKAFYHLSSAIWTTPCHALQAWPQVVVSLKRMLKIVSISTHDILGMIKLKAFGIIYTIILKEWLKEEIFEPSDMMIEIDKRLKQIASILK